MQKFKQVDQNRAYLSDPAYNDDKRVDGIEDSGLGTSSFKETVKRMGQQDKRRNAEPGCIGDAEESLLEGIDDWVRDWLHPKETQLMIGANKRLMMDLARFHSFLEVGGIV